MIKLHTYFFEKEMWFAAEKWMFKQIHSFVKIKAYL